MHICVYEHKHIHTQNSLKEVKPLGPTTLPYKNYRLTKTPVRNMRNLFSNAWYVWFKWLLNNMNYWHRPSLSVPQRSRMGPYCWREHTLRTNDSQFELHLTWKFFPLPSSLHGIRKYYASCQDRDSIKQPYLAAIPVSTRKTTCNIA